MERRYEALAQDYKQLQDSNKQQGSELEVLSKVCVLLLLARVRVRAADARQSSLGPPCVRVLGPHALRLHSPHCPGPQELVSLRERNAALSAQLSANSSTIATATTTADSLSGDNAKLHEAITLLRSSQAEKAEEIAKLLGDNARLRSDKLRLEADLQEAGDAAASSERKLKSAQEVSGGGGVCDALCVCLPACVCVHTDPAVLRPRPHTHTPHTLRRVP